MALKSDEKRLVNAIAAFAQEHGMPNRVSFAELSNDYGGSLLSAMAAGRVWANANRAIPEALLEYGIIVVKDADGYLAFSEN